MRAPPLIGIIIAIIIGVYAGLILVSRIGIESVIRDPYTDLEWQFIYGCAWYETGELDPPIEAIRACEMELVEVLHGRA